MFLTHRRYWPLLVLVMGLSQLGMIKAVVEITLFKPHLLISHPLLMLGF
jgi:hypothetical protein